MVDLTSSWVDKVIVVLSGDRMVYGVDVVVGSMVVGNLDDEGVERDVFVGGFERNVGVERGVVFESDVVAERDDHRAVVGRMNKRDADVENERTHDLELQGMDVDRVVKEEADGDSPRTEVVVLA